MPFGIGKHSNRSQPALDDRESQRASASQRDANNSAARPQQQQQQQQQHQQSDDDNLYEPSPTAQYLVRNEAGQYIPNTVPGIDPRSFPQESGDTPSRSQSQRYSTGYTQQSHLVNEGRPGPQDPTFANAPAVPVHKSFSTSGPNPRLSQPAAPPAEKKKSRGLFGFASKKDKHEPVHEPQSSDYNNLGGLNRRASKSQKQPPPQLQRIVQGTDDRQPVQQTGIGFPSAQSSESHLPSPQEGEEDGIYRQDPEDFDDQQLAQQGYDPRDPRLNHPSIRIARTEGDPTLRQVDGSPTHAQYLQQQQFAQQQQRLAQHQAQLSQQQHQLQHAPVSTENLVQEEEEYSQQSGQYQSHLNSGNQLYTNLPHRTAQNPEVVSQLSHESPTEGSEDQRPPSSATQVHAPGAYPSSPSEYPSRSTSFQGQRPQAQEVQSQGAMPPPPTGNGNANRRSADAKTTLGAGDSRGPPPGYAQQFTGQGSSQSTNATSPLPPNSGQAGAGNFRGSGLPREFQAGASEQGRSTPPLPTDNSRTGEASELDKLVQKYKKVKGLYFEKNAQVEQLQNTLANQRLSQSRTSLDDSEYITRFSRLDGAIKEIAFSIRKDWRTIPVWLQPYVNADAQKVGTKEMTAVGRASISRWIYDEIFSKCFHPSLNIEFSANLKRMEQNIRRFSSLPTNLEEENALSSKVIQWKLTTIDSLTDHFNNPDSAQSKIMYTRTAVENLTAHLKNHLVEPTPQGIEGNATSIIELAVGICLHLPKESREILISYPLPGDNIHPTAMKVEAALPPLEIPVSEDSEAASISSGDKEEESEGKGGKLKKIDKKAAVPQSTARKGPADRKDLEGKVRFAAAMGVEVKGRQQLVAAPVWGYS